MFRAISRVSLAPLALVLTTLALRAIFDKLLAISPDWTLVAHWAQAQSLYDLTAAVTLAGVGQGLTVFAARRDADQTGLMRDALIWGALTSAAAAAALLIATPWLNAAFGREIAPAGAVGALAVAGGLMSTATGLFYLLWQGRRERGKMLALVIVAAAPTTICAAGLLGGVNLERLLFVQLATQGALALALVWPLLRRMRGSGAFTWRTSPLRRYIPAGLSIGILSPASVLWSRAELAHGLSWEEVSQLQALWRASEWVTGLAGGLLVLVFLPRMAAATSQREFRDELARTWRMLCIPGALTLAVLWAGQSAIMPLLYSSNFLMPAAASALFLTGDALRLASWVPLHGLYATERVHAIAVGEWLSLPLFAALLTATGGASLVLAGACYAFTYVVYLGFNVWSVLRTNGRYATAAA